MGIEQGWRVVRVPITHSDAAVLVEAVQQEYVVRYGGRDHSPVEPTTFDPPRGSFYVGYLGDLPVASGAWRLRVDVTAFGLSRTAEIKRMYVVPAARHAGSARRMLAHLEQTARESGSQAMILETGIEQPEAIALYESSGYTPIHGFGYHAAAPESRCFGKRL